MTNIFPKSASISDSARLADGVRVGHFVVIEDDVEVGPGCLIEDFSLLQSGSRIEAGTRVGTYTKIGRGVVIGRDCSFTSYCEIRDGCQLGDRVTMGSRCTLSAGTIVDDEVVMKYSFVVTDTPVLSRNAEKSVGRLGRGARFGANVVIMPGVSVGANAEIGACSQVRHDVPADEVWFGTPAKFYRRV